MRIKEKYATEIEGPKRLIVGGSDALYSFNTDLISEKTNVPTVNFGLNVGLGMGFILDVARRNIKSGDEVILCLAYSLYFKPSYDVFAYEYYRMLRKRELRHFSWKQHGYYILLNLKLNIKYFMQKFKSGEEGEQRPLHFSESGSCLDADGSAFAARKNIPLQFPDKFEKTASVLALEKFYDACTEKGITVYITYPSTLGFERYKDLNYLSDLEKYVTGRYDVIGKPSDYFVPYENIYNSVYHVNSKGQEKRSMRFLEELQLRKGDSSTLKNK
ncbi:hypothetical protein [Listeria cornellensis]|nr:hypothetical protein [Listeria cornellensis]